MKKPRAGILRAPRRPSRIRVNGRLYRKAQDEEEVPVEPTGDFTFKGYDLGEAGANAMAQMMVAGLAAKLVQDGIDKDTLKKANVSDAAGNFTTWLKQVAQQRAAFKEEVRLLQRYGPQQYLMKKAQQMKGAAG